MGNILIVEDDRDLREALCDTLALSGYEVIGVADGYAAQYPFIKVLHSGKGKGAAVRVGMLEGKGRYLFMCDSDLSMPIAEVRKFLPPVLRDYDVAIASREGPGAHRYNEPAYRHFIGRVFNTMVRWMALPGLQGEISR